MLVQVHDSENIRYLQLQDNDVKSSDLETIVYQFKPLHIFLIKQSRFCFRHIILWKNYGG